MKNDETMTQSIEFITNELGESFGPLDNEIAKWVDKDELLDSFFARIKKVLARDFGETSAAARIFAEGVSRYLGLLNRLRQSAESREVIDAGIGFINWRMYVLLNSFLLAAGEALEKKRNTEAMDLDAGIEKSYYAPYFFERLTTDRASTLAMIEKDIEQLSELPRDKKGILAALRIRNGVYATLVEEYCPEHPITYFYVAQLNEVKVGLGIEVIDGVMGALQGIRAKINQTEVRQAQES